MIPKHESETIEFKKTISELKEGVISLTSMLNKHGEGVLYFGVKNDGIGFYFEFYRNNVSNDIINDTINDTIKTFEKDLLEFIRKNKGILNSISDAMLNFNKSRITIQRALATLIQKGYIVRVGSNKVGYWKVVK